MSGFRSSSPPRSKAESHSNINFPIENALAVRRPSWTPSITESEDTRHRSKHSEENLNALSDWGGSVPGLLKSRRPSFPPPITEAYQRARKPRVEPEESPEALRAGAGGSQPASEGKSLYSSWEINVKDLVGDAVGNMSISPASRDIVLAARRGLFIIDLDYPLRIPRFLPQGGTWDVADVQWNPHPSHAQYIVSTSSEKLLIWNLRLGGKTSIEHILKSHYRAITDINWHTSECDIVVSTGIDSWVWAWDLREPNKPIFGLSAFKAGGTQVKWNYQDGNLLASSHSNEVLIWDRRKGSLPVTQIRAHASKIYGIDWSRTSHNEIVTCSLDKSIKTWDINAINSVNPEPKSCIRTTYPVWRARNLPFGEGILSLPQRGETTLEMYAKDDPHAPIEVFEGHSDVVKEFVWRKGDQDDFQLITWSKDRTLRFWPIDGEAMQKVGHVPEVVRGRSKLTRSEMENHDTFRNPPDMEVKETYSAISAPVGNRGILAEVRASHPSKGTYPITRAFEQHPSSRVDDENATPTLTNRRSIAFVAGRSVGGTMSKGGTGIKNAAQLDQLTWLASVKVGSKRGSSSGGGSHGASRAPSRLRSASRPRSGPDRSVSEIGGRQRSGSLSRGVDDRKEADSNQSLQDEITTVLTKLAASKIKLEKHDLTKKRTCTLGLHGPWGETSSVFMRVTFIFPRDYPYGSHPHGTPAVELERNPLISMRARTYILKHLRRIRERKRPCLEACLRFLLFADEGHTDQDLMDSESSSDDDQPSGKKSRDITISLLRNNKNLAEPRTSQGAFGPNGELICFFRAPPRIVRNVLRDLTGAGNKAAEEPATPQTQEQPQLQPQQQKKSYFQSPALVSDAVRRLGLAATDRTVQPIDPRRPEAELNILRAMTNLLTMPQQQARRDPESKQPEEVPKNYALLASRRSTVFLTSTRDFTGADQKVTLDYIFVADSLAVVCDTNADVARRHGRFDHERIFKTLATLFNQSESGKKERESSFTSDSLAAQVIKQLYSDLVIEKDVQMLAMIAMLVLQTEHGATVHVHPSMGRRKESFTPVPHVAIPSRFGGMDYFSLTKAINPTSPISPAWPRLPSPVTAPLAPSVSSSNSSRGSWSSLFNTGSAVRQFMNGVQDTFKDGLTTPTETMSTTPSLDIQHGASRSAEKLPRGQDTAAYDPRRKRIRKESSFHSPSLVSKSWNDGVGTSSKMTSSFSSAGHKNPSSNLFMTEKRTIVFEPPIYEETAPPLFDADLIGRFKLNVYAYSELLFRWQMYHKRLELLKAVNQRDVIPTVKTELHSIGLHRICIRPDCKMMIPEKSHTCQYCGASCSMPACTVCRLPVKGLSRTCLSCSHVTHISCWNSLEVTVPICPSGCGCFCTGSDGPFTRPSTRLGLTPPTSTLLFASDTLP